jgi:hypothetical protein
MKCYRAQMQQLERYLPVPLLAAAAAARATAAAGNVPQLKPIRRPTFIPSAVAAAVVEARAEIS